MSQCSAMLCVIMTAQGYLVAVVPSHRLLGPALGVVAGLTAPLVSPHQNHSLITWSTGVAAPGPPATPKSQTLSPALGMAPSPGTLLPHLPLHAHHMASLINSPQVSTAGLKCSACACRLPSCDLNRSRGISWLTVLFIHCLVDWLVGWCTAWWVVGQSGDWLTWTIDLALTTFGIGFDQVDSPACVLC